MTLTTKFGKHSDPDPEFAGLVFTVLVDVCFFGVCWIMFTLQQRYKPLSPIIEPGRRKLSDVFLDYTFIAGTDEVKNHGDNDDAEQAHGFLAGMQWKMKRFLSWLSHVVTEWSCFASFEHEFHLPKESILYLRFQQYMIIALTVLSIIAMAVLIPTYMAADTGNVFGQKTIFWLYIASARNVPLASRWLFVPLFVAFLTIIVVIVVLHEFRKDVARVSGNIAAPTERGDLLSRAIFIKHLPRHVDSAMLAAHYNARFGSQKDNDAGNDSVIVAECHVIFELKSVLDLYRTKMKLTEQVEVLKERILTPNDDDLSSTIDMYGEKNHRAKLAEFRQELSAVSHKLREAIRTNDKQRSTGNAFVFFLHWEHARDAVSAVGESAKTGKLCDDPRVLDDTQWKVNFAPAAHDFIWNSVCTDSTKLSTNFKFIFWNFILFLTMIVIVTPISVAHYLGPFLTAAFESTHIALLGRLGAYLQAYLPTLAIVFVNSMMLPVMIEWTADREGHRLKAKRAKSVLTKFCLFMFLNVVVLPTFALESIQAFLNLVLGTQDVKQWEDLLGNAFLYSSGAFFMQYTVQAGLLGSGVQLLLLPQRATRWWNLKFAETKKEIEIAKQHGLFNFGYYYSYRVTIFGLVLIYSVLCPLLLPCGLIYAVVCYRVDKHNMVNNAYRVETASGLAYKGRVPILASNILRGYLLLFLFGVVSYLAVQRDTLFEAIAVILFAVLATVVVLMIFQQCSTAMKSKNKAETLHRVPSVLSATKLHGTLAAMNEEQLVAKLQDFAQKFHHPLLRADFQRIKDVVSDEDDELFTIDEERMSLLESKGARYDE